MQIHILEQKLYMAAAGFPRNLLLKKIINIIIAEEKWNLLRGYWYEVIRDINLVSLS